MNLIAVVVFALINGIMPSLSWLWMIPIIAGFVVVTTGVSLLLSALYVRFRDIKPIWDVTAQILFYATPIMYVASRYQGAEHIALLNPFALMLTQMGHAFIHPPGVAMRSASAAAGGPLHVAASILLMLGIFALGWFVFTREAPGISENL
jgi:ABC-2 type transport system permease protein